MSGFIKSLWNFDASAGSEVTDYFASRIPENCQRVSGAKKLR